MNAKARVTNALQKYFHVPAEQRSADIWFTKAMEAEMRELGLSSDEIGVMMMTVYWGLTTNARRAAFWVLTYSLYTPGLIDVLRAETAPALVDPSGVDFGYLAEKCPRLTAVWHETLRMAASAASVRFLTHDASINGWILRKGNRVMIPFRKIHTDTSVFGEDAGEFKPDRFLKDPELHRSMRAFGGGATMCPGRHMAKLWVCTYVTMMIHKFDLVLEGDQPFPLAQEESPSLGIMASKGDDLLVRLKPRQGSS